MDGEDEASEGDVVEERERKEMVKLWAGFGSCGFGGWDGAKW